MKVLIMDYFGDNKQVFHFKDMAELYEYCDNRFSSDCMWDVNPEDDKYDAIVTYVW